jgi:alpha-1,2-glucosyltransferase
MAVPRLLNSIISSGPTWSNILPKLPRPWIILMLSVLAAVVVHHNTIVHPFTLADNRHYVFYVFRILLRHWSVKFLVTPIYVICGWVVIHTLGGSSNTNLPTKPIKDEKTGINSSDHPSKSSSSNGCHASFVLAWLAATTLSLITAPLVEPRYFIVPWVVWRLHVCTRGQEELTQNMAIPKSESQRVGSVVWRAMRRPEAWLWMETIWFCLINCVTGFIFLSWTFQWPQEPGKMQRFMW